MFDTGHFVLKRMEGSAYQLQQFHSTPCLPDRHSGLKLMLATALGFTHGYA